MAFSTTRMCRTTLIFMGLKPNRRITSTKAFPGNGACDFIWAIAEWKGLLVLQVDLDTVSHYLVSSLLISSFALTSKKYIIDIIFMLVGSHLHSSVIVRVQASGL